MEVSTTSTADPVNMYNYINNMLLNPTVFFIILIIIILYFVLFRSLGNSNNEINMENMGNMMGTENKESSKIFGFIIIFILVVLIVVNALQYFFSINVTASIQNLFSPTHTLDVTVDQTKYQPSVVPEIKFKKQVFNIPGNYYNYENAKALCTAYGSRLANYNEIEDAYKNGGDWCNYGWSDGQMALFPTQQKTFDNLQKIEGHENDCGRPGINGGYMINPQLRFGVNCYGNKPKITPEEEELMKTTPQYPVTMKDIAFQKRVDFWKTKVTDILVSPFNSTTWGSV
jgi:hypothetical protein